MTRQLSSLAVVAPFGVWVFLRSQPSPETSSLASADMPVAGVLAALTALSYLVAPRLMERGSGHSARTTATTEVPRAPARVSSRTVGRVEPWARTFIWSFCVALPSLVLLRLVIPVVDEDPEIVVPLLVSAPVFMWGVVAFASWTPSLRALRALPLSTNRLTLLLFGQPGCVYAAGLVSAGAVATALPYGFPWLCRLVVFLFLR